MKISEFQYKIEKLYGDKDRRRGIDKTFVWFIEEVGELARAMNKGDKASLLEEFGDCFAWLATLANMKNISLEKAIEKYSTGCNKCSYSPCKCKENFNANINTQT